MYDTFSMYHYLGNKDEALSDCGAEDTQHGTQYVHRVTVTPQQAQHRDDNHARNKHIVHCKANLFGIVQGWNVNFASFPCQVGAKEQKKAFVTIQ